MVSKDYKDAFKMMSEQDKRLWKFLALMFNKFGDKLGSRTLDKILDNYQGDLTRIYIKTKNKFYKALSELTQVNGVAIIWDKKRQIIGVEKRPEFEAVLKLIEVEEK